MSHLLLWGNAYAQIIRDGRGRVLGFYPLLPGRMTVDRTSAGELFYEYRKDSGYVILRPKDVLHIPGLGFDGLVGYSVWIVLVWQLKVYQMWMHFCVKNTI